MDASMIYGLGFVMIAVGVTFLWMLFKDNESKKPRDVVEWVGTVLSGLLIVSAISLIVLAKKSEEVVAIAGGQVATEAYFQDAIIEVPAGDFSFKSVDTDEEALLSSLQGKVVIVNFWATWCGPCLDEIPDLNRLQNEYRDQGLVVLSISDEDRSLLVSFKDQLVLESTSVYVPFGIDLPLPFKGAFAIRPSSFVIDKTGTVRRYLLGARNYDFFKKAVVPLLSES
jgi:cytochrome c biogenesis protein CcmG, thiol:disulfide interchange protein DsbE